MKLVIKGSIMTAFFYTVGAAMRTNNEFAYRFDVDELMDRKPKGIKRALLISLFGLLFMAFFLGGAL